MGRTTEDLTYSVTTNWWESIFWFGVVTAAQTVIEKLLEYRDHGHYLLHKFALTPSRLHLILTPCLLTLERSVQPIKSGSCSEIHKLRGSRTEVWQPGYEQVLMQSTAGYEAKRLFVINRPVSEKLTEDPKSWEWSSASGRYKLDPIPSSLAEKAIR